MKYHLSLNMICDMVKQDHVNVCTRIALTLFILLGSLTSDAGYPGHERLVVSSNLQYQSFQCGNVCSTKTPSGVMELVCILAVFWVKVHGIYGLEVWLHTFAAIMQPQIVLTYTGHTFTTCELPLWHGRAMCGPPEKSGHVVCFLSNITWTVQILDILKFRGSIHVGGIVTC